jgi:cytochrome b involved in lipid metabolism
MHAISRSLCVSPVQQPFATTAIAWRLSDRREASSFEHHCEEATDSTRRADDEDDAPPADRKGACREYAMNRRGAAAAGRQSHRRPAMMKRLASPIFHATPTDRDGASRIESKSKSSPPSTAHSIHNNSHLVDAMSFMSFVRHLAGSTADQTNPSMAGAAASMRRVRPTNARVFTPEEVAQHATEEDCYTIVEGKSVHTQTNISLTHAHISSPNGTPPFARSAIATRCC